MDPSREIVYNENLDAKFVTNNFSYAIVVVGEPLYVKPRETT